MSDVAKIASAHLKSVAGLATAVRIRGHTLTADEPASHEGTDTGPAPFELLLAALGACTSMTLRLYAARKGWSLGEIDVDLYLRRDETGDRIERTLRFGDALTDAQRTRLLEIAEKTPVTKAVRTGTPIATRIA